MIMISVMMKILYHLINESRPVIYVRPLGAGLFGGAFAYYEDYQIKTDSQELALGLLCTKLEEEGIDHRFFRVCFG